jgi:spore coat polysaccharide biosynthesis predicted glycosyltransferase SpsG
LKVIFKTSINKKKGTGHFFRCLAFAKFLQSNFKNEIIFFTNKINIHLKNILKKNSFKHCAVNSNLNFIKKLKKFTFIKYIIIDDPYLNFIEEKKLKSLGYKICAIEDNYKRHCADIIINPNYVDKKKLINLNKNSKYFYIGPQYVLNLKKVKKVKSYNKKNKNILIYMGGSDSKNYTEKILKTLNHSKFKKYNFVAIKGIINKRLNKINLLGNNIKIVDHKIDFENFLFKFEYCITSGGSSIWQMLYTNLKILVINQNLKQSYNSIVLQKKKYVRVFNKSISDKNLYLFFNKYIKNKQPRFKKFNFLNHGISKIAKKINED